MDKKSLILIIDIADYKPWSGAVETFDKIKDENMLEELEQMLIENYPEGLTITELNDLLWFDGEYVLERLGLIEEDEIEAKVDDEKVDDIQINDKANYNPLIGSPEDSDGELIGIRLWSGSGYYLNNPVYIYAKEIYEGELIRASILDENCLWIPIEEADDDLEKSDTFTYLDRTEYGKGCGYLCIENLKYKKYPERDLEDELQNEFFAKYNM